MDLIVIRMPLSYKQTTDVKALIYNIYEIADLYHFSNLEAMTLY
jgi:hypothetical protein